MTEERYNELIRGPDPQRLTPEELKAGWHWCDEMDGLLCKIGDENCFCVDKDHKSLEETWVAWIDFVLDNEKPATGITDDGFNDEAF